MPSRIFVVTPTLNSAATVLQTLYSVVLQAGNFQLHYHIQDGGSTDGTVELIAKMQQRIANGEIDVLCGGVTLTFDSSPDAGMYDAIYRAVERTGASGEDWVGWINSDDRLADGALALLEAVDEEFPASGVDWVAGATAVTRNNLVVAWGDRPLSSDLIAEGLCDGEHWDFVQQEGVFFRHRLWRQADPEKSFASFRYAGDWNLWRVLAKRNRLYQVRWPLGVFTQTEGQLSQKFRAGYMAEIEKAVPARVRAAKLLTFKSREATRDLLVTHHSKKGIRLEEKRIVLGARLSAAIKADEAAIRELSISPYEEDDAVRIEPGMVVYDSDWQFPAITEKHAYLAMRKAVTPVSGICYFAFPWATLIDHLQVGGKRAPQLKARLLSLRRELSKYDRVVTVCQHIYMDRFVDLLLDVGVTDVFWSHARRNMGELGRDSVLRVYPFPLFPVQRTDDSIQSDDRQQRYLYSFVGAKSNDYYLTHSRNMIFEELSREPRGYVRLRDSWHYEKIVYQHQILGRAGRAQDCLDAEHSAEYRSLLKESTFTLCPSGSGPNSIRLWEAIEAGSIPVVLSDSYRPPGDERDWELATVECVESREAIRELPARLAKIAADRHLLAAKRGALRRISARYGPGTFVYDIKSLYCGFLPKSFEESSGLSRFDWLVGMAAEIQEGRASDSDRRLFVICCNNEIITKPERFLLACQAHRSLGGALRLELRRGGADHLDIGNALVELLNEAIDPKGSSLLN